MHAKNACELGLVKICGQIFWLIFEEVREGLG